MKKKFGVNKFLTILSEPRKHKKLLNKEGKHPYGFEYPNEFGLDTDEFYYEIPVTLDKELFIYRIGFRL